MLGLGLWLRLGLGCDNFSHYLYPFFLFFAEIVLINKFLSGTVPIYSSSKSVGIIFDKKFSPSKETDIIVIFYYFFYQRTDTVSYRCD